MPSPRCPVLGRSRATAVQHGGVRRSCAGIRDQRGDKRVLLQATFLAAAPSPPPSPPRLAAALALNGCCHALPSHPPRAFHQEEDAPLRELKDRQYIIIQPVDQPATYHLAESAH